METKNATQIPRIKIVPMVILLCYANKDHIHPILYPIIAKDGQEENVHSEENKNEKSDKFMA